MYTLIQEKRSRIFQLEDAVEMMEKNWNQESHAEDEKEKLEQEMTVLKRELVALQNRDISMMPAHADGISKFT